MAWIIEYTHSAAKQLSKLDKPIALSLLDFMDQRIAPSEDPRSLAKKLVGPKIGEYWRYRVGDIRVICDISEENMRVLVIEIGNRKEVYR